VTFDAELNVARDRELDSGACGNESFEFCGFREQADVGERLKKACSLPVPRNNFTPPPPETNGRMRDSRGAK